MDIEDTNLSSKNRLGLSDDDHATLRRQTERVMSEVRELGHVAKSSTNDALGHAKQRGREVLTDAREQSRELVDRTNGYVQEHPLRSLAGAAAVGSVIALLIRR